MTLQVTARGIAKRSPYYLQKNIPDLGESVHVAELLHVASEIMESKGVHIAATPSGAAKGMEKIAHMTFIRMLSETLFWFCAQEVQLVIFYTKSGIWGGVLRQPKFFEKTLYFKNQQYLYCVREFINLLREANLDKLGYMRALLEAMSGYETHCATYDIKNNVTYLRINLNED
ncbi:MAG: hypothetical protein KDJ34_14075 [Candidatus Competibacteraceae bacterium]|nr:hypothetical protein [Candidatus Competibacteraceae bacterium]